MKYWREQYSAKYCKTHFSRLNIGVYHMHVYIRIPMQEYYWQIKYWRFFFKNRQSPKFTPHQYFVLYSNIIRHSTTQINEMAVVLEKGGGTMVVAISLLLV